MGYDTTVVTEECGCYTQTDFTKATESLDIECITMKMLGERLECLPPIGSCISTKQQWRSWLNELDNDVKQVIHYRKYKGRYVVCVNRFLHLIHHYNGGV